jgi:hypothetical protein
VACASHPVDSPIGDPIRRQRAPERAGRPHRALLASALEDLAIGPDLDLDAPVLRSEPTLSVCPFTTTWLRG